MAFFKARIKKVELTKDLDNKITKIYFVIEMQDDSLAAVKEFDYVIDGNTLEEIRGTLKLGVQNLIREQVKQKYPEWITEAQKLIETKSDLTPAQIAVQFISEITKLD
mgnify:CR=1 FL=1